MQLTARDIPVSGQPRKGADASGPGTGPASPLGVRCVSLSFAQWTVAVCADRSLGLRKQPSRSPAAPRAARECAEIDRR